MRILHILNHTDHSNGHVHAAVDLACAQAKLGHVVAVASQGGDFDKLLMANNVVVFNISHKRSVSQLIMSSLRLFKLYQTWRPDVVHAHMMTSAVLAWTPCKLFRVGLVTTVHNEFKKASILMGLGTKVIAVSAAVSKSMHRRGIPESRLQVVLNGTIGSVRNSNRTDSPKLLKHPAIIFVGGLHPRKGLPDLLEAFDHVYAEFPAAHLYIIGGGPYRNEYTTLAQRMPSSSSITFAGPQLDPFPWMTGADIFVLPSHADPAPLVISEAREAGCAIIATNVDGIPELLNDGSAGILVPPGNPEKISEALKHILSNQSQLDFWRLKSQENIGFLRIERVANQTIDIYKMLDLPSRGRKSGA